jgi:hypothetical protein
MLELGDRLRVEQVIFAIAPPLILPAPVQIRFAHRALGVGVMMAQARFFCDNLKTNTADARGSPGEIPIDKGLIEPDGLKDLGAPLGAAAFRLYACRLQLFEGVDDPQPILNNQPILHVF